MAAYLVVEHIVTDAAKFEEYRIKVAPMIAKHGGRYLTKGGSHKMPEGGQETGARRDHRISGHGFAQRLVQLAGISAADCPSQAIHQRAGYDVHARRRLNSFAGFKLRDAMAASGASPLGSSRHHSELFLLRWTCSSRHSAHCRALRENSAGNLVTADSIVQSNRSSWLSRLNPLCRSPL